MGCVQLGSDPNCVIFVKAVLLGFSEDSPLNATSLMVLQLHDTKVSFPCVSVSCAVSLHLLQQSIASVAEVGSQLGGIAL